MEIGIGLFGNNLLEKWRYALNRLERHRLMRSAHWGNIDSVKLLISCGADVNACDTSGFTTLMDTACST